MPESVVLQPCDERVKSEYLLISRKQIKVTCPPGGLQLPPWSQWQWAYLPGLGPAGHDERRHLHPWCGPPSCLPFSWWIEAADRKSGVKH